MLRCPISGAHPFSDPVVLPDGYTYERSAAQAYLASAARVSPVTGQPFPAAGRGGVGVVENTVLRMLCAEWRELAGVGPAAGTGSAEQAGARHS